MRALIFVHKLAVLPQVREILTRYPVQAVGLVYPTEGNKLSPPMLRRQLGPWLEGLKVEFHAYDFFKQMAEFHALARSGQWDLVAVPYVGGRPYYRLRYWFGRAGKFVVISDGTCDSSSLWDFYRRIRIHQPLDYLKALVMATEVRWLARADEAYSLFHPLPCCFARQTHPATPLPVAPERAERIRKLVPGPGPVDYVAQGYSVTFEEAVRKFGLQNAVTTIKRPLDSEDFFTGEDLVDVLRPRRIVGYCCEVLMYARKFSPETECIAIMDPGTDKYWGCHHNAVYRKQAALLGGMKFLTMEEYLKL
jgi:hypothetical protein